MLASKKFDARSKSAAHCELSASAAYVITPFTFPKPETIPLFVPTFPVILVKKPVPEFVTAPTDVKRA